MATTNIDMTTFFKNVCKYYGAVDPAELMESEAFKTAYAETHSASPGLDATDIRAKALKAMRYVSEGNTTVNAHCAVPVHKNVGWDKDAGSFIIKSLGTLLVMPDGRTKHIKFVDFDPLKTLESQVPAGGFVAGLERGGAVTVNGVNVSRDLYEGTVSTRITNDVSIVGGGHSEPFPDGPTLEYVIGDKAIQDGQGNQQAPTAWKGAWRLVKKYGTVNGEFGSIEGDPQLVVGTVSEDVDEIRVNTFGEDPSKFHVQATVYDANGNAFRPKFPMPVVEEQLGLDPMGDPDGTKMQLAGQRVLLRGKGNILAMKDTKDFGEAWDTAYSFLQENGYFTNYGQKGLKRLNLSDKKIRGPNGEDMGNQISVKVGDRTVYDIVQEFDRTTGDKKWTLYTFCEDEGRLPWMDCIEHHYTYKRDIPDMGITEGDPGVTNEGAFIQFLDGVGGGAALAEDDPFKLAIQQMSLPMTEAPPVPETPVVEVAAEVTAEAVVE